MWQACPSQTWYFWTYVECLLCGIYFYKCFMWINSFSQGFHRLGILPDLSPFSDKQPVPMGYGRAKFLEFQYSSLCHFDLILNGKPIPYPLDVALKKKGFFFRGGQLKLWARSFTLRYCLDLKSNSCLLQEKWNM